MKKTLAVLATAAVLGLSANAQAALITYNFTGSVNADHSLPGDPLAGVLNCLSSAEEKGEASSCPQEPASGGLTSAASGASPPCGGGSFEGVGRPQCSLAVLLRFRRACLSSGWLLRGVGQ